MKNTIQKLHFFKNEDNQWIVNSPGVTTDLEELIMLNNASLFCDIVSQGDEEFKISIYDKKFNGAIPLINLGYDKEIGGCWYFLTGFNQIDYNLDFWLGDYVKNLFGAHPPILYFMKNHF